MRKADRIREKHLGIRKSKYRWPKRPMGGKKWDGSGPVTERSVLVLNPRQYGLLLLTLTFMLIVALIATIGT